MRCPQRSVAHLPLTVLPTLLRVDGALGSEAGVEALKPDLLTGIDTPAVAVVLDPLECIVNLANQLAVAVAGAQLQRILGLARSEEHTSELQSLMRISYAVFCLKTKKSKLTY